VHDGGVGIKQLGAGKLFAAVFQIGQHRVKVLVELVAPAVA